MYEYILFDLDGTLTDSKEGICKCVQYALKKQGIDEPNLDVLEPFIGPPLSESFKEFYHMNEEQIEKAVVDYRERFSATGLYENALYDGIDDVLSDLNNKGKHLAVASSKPQEFVKRILKHFKINKYFDVVVGSELDGRRSNKAEAIEEALKQLYSLEEGADVKEYLSNNKDIKLSTVMVGDRKFDIKGAKDFGIASVGVKYGFAPKGELETAGAGFIAKSVSELHDYLLNGNKKKKERIENKSSFFKSLNVILPLVWYYFMMIIVSFVSSVIIRVINDSGDVEKILWISNNSTLMSGIILATALVLISLVLLVLFRKTDKLVVKMKTTYIFYFAGGALLGLGLNVLLPLFAKVSKIEALKYEGSDMVNNLPVLMGFLVFVILSPVMEELLFRWLIYGRMKAMLNASMAVILSAVFFGFYHGNLLQGIYAVIMGIVMAIIYEKSGSILSSMLFHIGANGLVYGTKYLSDSVKIIIGGIPAAIIMVITGIVILTIGYKSKTN